MEVEGGGPGRVGNSQFAQSLWARESRQEALLGETRRLGRILTRRMNALLSA